MACIPCTTLTVSFLELPVISWVWVAQDLTRYHIDQWVDWSNNLDNVYANWIYFLYGMRPYADAAGTMPAAQLKFESLLTALDTHMAGKTWLVGDSLTLAVSATQYDAAEFHQRCRKTDEFREIDFLLITFVSLMPVAMGHKFHILI